LTSETYDRGHSRHAELRCLAVAEAVGGSALPIAAENEIEAGATLLRIPRSAAKETVTLVYDGFRILRASRVDHGGEEVVAAFEFQIP
jgi:hypothetical protein